VPLELPELRTIDLDGPVRYRTWDGPPESTFVLIHGLGGSHLTWAQVAPGLAGLGRVLALDLPGFGASPRAGRPTGLMDLRKTVSGFLVALASGRTVVVGNSLGGGLGVLQAAVEPPSVDGLVLTSSIFPWSGGRVPLVPAALPHPAIGLAFGAYGTPRLGEWFVKGRARRLDAERLVRLGLRYATEYPERIPREVVEAFVDLVRERSEDPEATTAFLETARSMLRLGRRPLIARRALDRVTCPVLVIHGRRDRLVPAVYAEAELTRHPDWRGRFFPDVGHVPQMEAPGRWLSEVADWAVAVLR
jgi:pimeloyl-ACP methyl ester carboxylesterase